MASTPISTLPPPPYSYNSVFLLLVLLLLMLSRSCCYGFGTFGFDIHHRYSDPVMGMLPVDELPVKDSLQYYAAMAHRDRLIHGRRLATADGNQSVPLAFFYGNETYRIGALGFLHYANVSVGTPSLSFLVALDTGSNLFWLPCDCSSCLHNLSTSSGELELSIYSPSKSSTSRNVTCDSTLCTQQNRCPSAQSNCPYQVVYLSNGTSSTGVYVQDELHLISDDTQLKAVDARITFGCGQIQTGSFLDGAAPNGLFGLGMANVSVPSTLAREGYTSNSFSMCFGPNGVGRITFGDEGGLDLGETPLNLDTKQSRSIYNISIIEINVGGNDHDLEFSAIFDSGTSFTYLNDPAYSLISQSFNNLVNEERHSGSFDVPFEYCYDISPNQTRVKIPTVHLVMKGGDYFNTTDPIVMIKLEGGAYVYCLGVVKSGDVNIIGQNFMTGYRIVFNIERKVLGWRPSNCYDIVDSNTLPIDPTSAPPATAINPEATAGSSNNSQSSEAPASLQNHSPQLNSFICSLMMILISFFAIV